LSKDTLVPQGCRKKKKKTHTHTKWMPENNRYLFFRSCGSEKVKVKVKVCAG
jgi:hypothetical protein